MAEAVRILGLRYTVLTSVTRDDLADGGAAHFAAVVRAVRVVASDTRVELLIPDFQGNAQALATVLAAAPRCSTTTWRPCPASMPRPGRRPSTSAAWNCSTGCGRWPRAWSLRAASWSAWARPGPNSADCSPTCARPHCDLLTIGQYLQPSRDHLPVARFVPPEEFAELRDEALALGFRAVAAGPFVRSSYQAETLYRRAQGHTGPLNISRPSTAISPFHVTHHSVNPLRPVDTNWRLNHYRPSYIHSPGFCCTHGPMRLRARPNLRDPMLQRKNPTLQLGQFLALVASLLIAAQIGYTLYQGSPLCLNDGCNVVEKLTRVSPLVFNVVGFFFFQVVYWGLYVARGEMRRLPQFIKSLLLAALAVEAVLIGFQYLVAQAFCAYCLGILVFIVLLNLLLGWRQIVPGFLVFVAAILAFASLDLNQSAPGEQAFTAGVFASRPGLLKDPENYLFYSSTCAHCERVIASLQKQCPGHYPLQSHRSGRGSIDLPKTTLKASYSPASTKPC